MAIRTPVEEVRCTNAWPYHLMREMVGIEGARFLPLRSFLSIGGSVMGSALVDGNTVSPGALASVTGIIARRSSAVSLPTGLAFFVGSFTALAFLISLAAFSCAALSCA